MVRITSLGSGSSGNAFLVQTERSAVLIDCGVAVRSCTAAVRELTPHARVDAVVVSHEHIDHVRSLSSLLRRGDCALVTTPGTRRALRMAAACTEVLPSGRVEIGDIDITFIGVAHDAAEPCGFFVEGGGTRAAIFTDLGHVTSAVHDALRAADVIVLEANYDPAMLRSGRYPAHLKRRISGSHGHLSNDDCAAALAVSATSASHIWLAHLSENNNHPRIAGQAVANALTLQDIATPAAPLPRFERQNLQEHVERASQTRLAL
jgi:phosphoribosyl 1,2-cyclic phosphodiesterase